MNVSVTTLLYIVMPVQIIPYSTCASHSAVLLITGVELCRLLPAVAKTAEESNEEFCKRVQEVS